MRLCYQVATPDVAISPAVTAWQGPPAESFARLAALGYGGVELMTLDPAQLDAAEIHSLARRHGLAVTLVCTGEVYGQLGISFTDPDETVRKQAVARVASLIDFAGFLGANLNIGRVRGQFRADVAAGQTVEWAVDALQTLSDRAAPQNVIIALETVCCLQTNFINTLREADELLARVARPNCKLMLDVFHLNIEEKDLSAAIRQHCASTVHVHLADNNRRYPGQCGLNFGQIAAVFAACGYTGDFCTEILQLPNQDTAAAESIRHLRPIFAEAFPSG